MLMAVLVGCSTKVEQNQRSAVNMDVNGNQKSPIADSELIGLVEKFSEDVGDKGQAAWQKIQAYPRKDVIDSLSRLQQNLPANDSLRPKVAFVLCNMDYNYHNNKQVIVSALARHSQYQNFDADQAQVLLSRLIRRGDKELLRVLFAASSWSDGALSEGLADTFTQELRSDPEKFMLELKDQPEQTRRRVFALIESADSFTEEDKKHLRAYLSSVPKKSAISAIAEQLLATSALKK